MTESNSLLTETTFTEGLFLIPEKTVIILDTEWAHLPKEETDLLAKILKAIGITMDAVTIYYQPLINLATVPTQPSRCLYFGQPVAGIATYEALEINGTKLVASNPLAMLLTDDELKKKLWQALKKLFSS
ncbi:MAG: DNA polymerase III subunit psi [Bacteroidetes bacterium]|nr:DNA polymerase III subunit psi [Bacteroidota bacterium]